MRRYRTDSPLGNDEDVGGRVNNVGTRTQKDDQGDQPHRRLQTSLPRPTAKRCGEANCMAFATQWSTGSWRLITATRCQREEYRANFTRLEGLMAPPVRTVIVGTGDRAMRLGGKYVLYRHELPTTTPPLSLSMFPMTCPKMSAPHASVPSPISPITISGANCVWTR